MNATPDANEAAARAATEAAQAATNTTDEGDLDEAEAQERAADAHAEARTAWLAVFRASGSLFAAFLADSHDDASDNHRAAAKEAR